MTELSSLETAAAGLLEFARGAVHPDGGFGWLDDAGRLIESRPQQAWITARMTHCFALASLRGDGTAARFVDHGVRALLGPMRDEVHGGWHSAVSGGVPASHVKEGYAHVFVVLAATSALAAGHPSAQALLDEALAVIDQRFWREDDGMIVDVWNQDWSELEPYRGANANMHAVEAFLAVADVTGERRWLDRSMRILERIVHTVAREHEQRLPEHFDAHWQVQLDYNRDEPRHAFRPYGVTIGHLFEWARLALSAARLLGPDAPAWLAEDARALYDAGVARGWNVDGAEGFVYTTDFADRPVVRERMHWVVCEAIAAASVLEHDLGVREANEHGRLWWQYADSHLIDRQRGSWHHELDPQNHPSATVWQGKPDIYHAYQATILPLLPAAASFAGAAVAARRS